MKRFQLLILFFVSSVLTALAQPASDSIRQLETPQVLIIAQKDRLLGSVPGSASYVKPIAIQRIAPISGNEVFRKLPGLHVVDEEGIGLRANIGIRGLNPDRSTNVLVLEDGIPIQLNPYGEPELYYTPSIDRMQAIEVVKGSGQIMFGPRTIGGVINYITADPPSSAQTSIGFRGGSGGYGSLQLSHGNTVGNTGFAINYLYKHADKIGVTGFNVHDLSARFKIWLGEKSLLGIKMQVYDEVSNATYVGLTQNMFDQGAYYTQLSPNDQLKIRRYALSATHKYYLNPNLKLTTNAYLYTTSRYWRRQDFSSSAAAPNQTGVVWGDPTIPNGALYMQSSSLARNRDFEVGGLESALQWKYSLGKYKSELNTGIRLLAERAFDHEIRGNLPWSASGALVNDERRPGRAFSAYAQNQVQLSTRWNVHLGLRAEQYHFERAVLLYQSSNGSYRDTLIASPSEVSAFIPGLGFRYRIDDRAIVFGGLHKGFAPPAIKNSVSKSGEVFPLDAQESWNYELGIRMVAKKGFEAECTGFVIDFARQVIPVSVSSGGSGSGFANAGRTLNRGVELGSRLDLGQLLERSWSLYWEGNATWVDARFNTDRFVGVDAVNVKNNRLPYAPEWMSTQSIGLATVSGMSLQLSGTYTSSQFTDELNTATPTANGRAGQIPAYWVIDASAGYNHSRWNTRFFASVKNLGDARYIASRRPQGIKVGIPRTLLAGVEVKF
ncbi:MAG: TonB-dependent receptor [Lewinellaceae bacterium]|nr:TonB-dependent receptor [Lewinellaceae bacterium]